MHSSIVLIVAALVAPIFAAPASIAQREVDITSTANHLEARANTVVCAPDTNASKTKSFTVDVAHAKNEAKIGGFKSGKSGDPHVYGNGDGINWGATECDARGASLWEYPVFWTGSNGKKGQLQWVKDAKNKDQKMKTPLRVVYANVSNVAHYCGVMTHSEVAADFQGKKFFKKCT